MNSIQAILAAIKAGSWAPILTTLITAAVSFGFLDTEQGSAANTAVAAVATAIAAIIAVVHTFNGVKLVRAEEAAHGQASQS